MIAFAGLGASQKCKREGGQKLNQNYPDCNIHDLRYLYCYGNKKDYAVGCCHSARRNKIIFRWYLYTENHQSKESSWIRRYSFHFILQNKYLRIYEDSFEAKILNIMIAPIMVGSLKKSIQPDGVHVFLA